LKEYFPGGGGRETLNSEQASWRESMVCGSVGQLRGEETLQGGSYGQTPDTLDLDGAGRLGPAGLLAGGLRLKPNPKRHIELEKHP